VKLGMFNIPYSLGYAEGERTAKQVIDWDLQVARWADEYGLSEVFFAEHYTIGHEPSPAPDAMIAAASQVTERVRLGAAAHLLPYHNPISLAHRLLWLDHMTGGRYIAGFAPGSFPTDAQLFDTGNRNPEMMREALDIILAVWTRPGPYRLEGEFWTLDIPAFSDVWQGPHLRPLQQPHPPAVVTGMQPRSPSFIEAARRGFLPMSQQVASGVLRQHWETYRDAASEAGFTPRRDDWRVIRDCFVADTDEQAFELALGGAFGRTWREHLLPTFKKVRQHGTGKAYSLAPLLTGGDISDEELTVEYLAEHFWMIGSPDTVVEKLAGLHEETGGFGTLVSFAFDYSSDPEPFRRSLELLGTEVAPRVAALGQANEAAAIL